MSSPTAPPNTDPNQSLTHTGPNSSGPTFPTNQPTSHEPHNTQTQNSPLPPSIFDPPNLQTNTDPVNEPPRTHLMITRLQSGIVKPIDRLSLNTFLISSIPKNPSDALKDLQWRNAIYDKYNALVKNYTWLLVPMLAGVNMVRSMWLFKHKFHADMNLSRYKARLVANGSSQQLGVDFDKTFSPVVKPATILMVLSLTVSRKWPIQQLDVKNAFFNGDLSETVYMHKLPGFVDARFPNHVCRFQRSLYGLKQAPHAWFQRFARYATRAGFYHSPLLQQLINSLHREFHMTILGALYYFLGLYLYASSTTSLVGYTDADWAGCPSTHSAKAEYRGVANVVAETAWLRNLLHGQVRVLHVPSCYQYADIFTKGLPSALFEEFQSSLSVRPPPTPTAGVY
nr:ribonuclease H-like domain-containing protein [Tanacetum cinerariifolium]